MKALEIILTGLAVLAGSLWLTENWMVVLLVTLPVMLVTGGVYYFVKPQ